MNEAQVANARAQLAEADTRLGYTKIYAPVTGRFPCALLAREKW